MMARTHVATSALAWMGVAPLFHVAPLPLAAGLVVAGGAGLLPDLDHPSASLAHTLGPVSHFAARGVHRLAGGHRQATHSLVATAAVGALALFAGTWVALAVVVGYGAHLAGDTLSVGGVPLLWPWRYRFRLPVCPVDSLRERVVAAGAGLGVAWLAWGVYAPLLRNA